TALPLAGGAVAAGPLAPAAGAWGPFSNSLAVRRARLSRGSTSSGGRGRTGRGAPPRRRYCRRRCRGLGKRTAVTSRRVEKTDTSAAGPHARQGVRAFGTRSLLLPSPACRKG